MMQEQTTTAADGLEELLRDVDGPRAVQKFAEMAAGNFRVLSPHEALEVIRLLDGVAVEFDPKDAFGTGRLYHDGEGYVLDEYPDVLPIPEAWDRDCLSHSEAWSYLDQGLRLRPAEVNDVD